MVAVLFHDRPHLARRCMASLKKAGRPYRLAQHYDHQGIGPARSLNNLLPHRRPGEDFCRVDSDVEFLTDNWLQKLAESPYDVTAPASEHVKGEGYIDVETPASGVTYWKGHVIDRLGKFTVYGRYGCEDLDYSIRAGAAGFRCAYDTSVRVSHDEGRRGTDADWKKVAMEDCLRRMRAARRV